ncbi:MAG: hypothetical protein JWR63_1881 [Conexibacter sp.]|nr:hypothetical protein [Conexibacter sp.]
MTVPARTANSTPVTTNGLYPAERPEVGVSMTPATLNGTPAMTVDDVARFLAEEPDSAKRENLVRLASVKALNLVPDDELDAYVAGKDPEGYRLELIGFDTITSKRTDWVWDARIPRGMISEEIGSEGLGKSALSIRLAEMASLGTLAGCFAGEPVGVALLTTEDDPERTIRPRLEAAGADLSMVKFVKLSKDGVESGVVLPRDAHRLCSALDAGGVRLLIVDPLVGLLDPRVNTYKDTDVREALTPLVVSAQEFDITVHGIRHTNKSKSTDPRERGIGSVGFRQIVRSQLAVTVDPDDPDGADGSGRMVCHTKCNVGRLQKSMKFKLEDATVMIEGKAEKLVQVVLGDECDWKASDGLAAEAGADGDRLADKARGAESMLREMLGGGPVAVKKLEAEAKSRDIGWRTVQTAKKALGVASWKPKGTNAQVWGWSGLDVV